MSMRIAALVLFSHAVHVGPEALLKPADLLEDLVAPRHLFLAVASDGVGELVDEGAAGVDKLDKGGRCPIWNERLMEDCNVRIGSRMG